jgi:hypothetical protein
MTSNIQTYALIAEIVGAIAILISLIFVGLEVRQSNTLVKTNALRESTQIWVGECMKAFGSEESTAFMRKAANHYDHLSKDEQGRFFALTMGFVGAFDNIYNQHEAGSLREEVFYSIALAYYGLVSFPGIQSVLTEHTPGLPPYILDYTVVDILAKEGERIKMSFGFLRE